MINKLFKTKTCKPLLINLFMYTTHYTAPLSSLFIHQAWTNYKCYNCSADVLFKRYLDILQAFQVPILCLCWVIDGICDLSKSCSAPSSCCRLPADRPPPSASPCRTRRGRWAHRRTPAGCGGPTGTPSPRTYT